MSDSAEQLRNEIVAALKSDDAPSDCHVDVSICLGGCDIEYGAMYDPPPLNLRHLAAIGKLFGTDDVTVNGYSVSGCETCDYGSDYGNTINVRNATRYVEEARELAKLGRIHGERR